ncbi:lipid IV(A) 3-deoxy-D-manno-octulosonic acid transferase [Halomonas sp. McH1-25]|uniref:lipid IV(A) 3-deoxy-D-manno-octulosonic acid transferase n=1 Tax=unclassified Halomonas TaxID=2609666 RepID=UPI001EF4AC7F|nr:lipid IV(A) 3-deoxy-D-manno-octulosonic acid transferase [Halomonas sp. McH1-25]MCP1342527.1 lipid IV(A) 3-deoxy-D-manno-octulosonic acid transferase [Halomonas sp. FL8]MCP1363190.1 lipid IV(A) 3-deoxy-D-manno-octulosonic acid transferase [Halomonas sp. BBD45]MCP1365020.1 lipid IV(A) 3-deoxy-D-manno-octulosonic acid transferase [Halomonas sp. BBD48]
MNAKRRVSSAPPKGWARWLYSGALYALSPLIWRRVWREQVATHSRCERLGSVPGANAATLWLHAASVGEVIAARPLIEALRNRYPAHRLVVTTMTATGAERVEALFKDEVIHHFVPLDFPGASRRFVSTLAPELAIFFETELWPNLLEACHRQGVPVAVVNGRLSARAMRGYRRLGALMINALAKVDWLAAKSSEDAGRFRELGMPGERVDVVGSLKFDIDVDARVHGESERLRTSFGTRPVWIAASTHPGEDEQVLAAHRRVRGQYPHALLILVPRHPQRFDDVAALCRERGESLARRSRSEPVQGETTVYLGDTMGELMSLYGAADVAFVGGSLVPVGGHNLLEPAILGVPVLSGPELANFSDVAEVLHSADALMEVADAEALGAAVSDLFASSEKRLRQGKAGKAAVMAQRGALVRTLDGLERLLPRPSRVTDTERMNSQ